MNLIVRNIRLALKSLGYQESKAKKWTKVIGHHLITFEEERGEFGEWTNWFRSAGEGQEILRWDTRKLAVSDGETEEVWTAEVIAFCIAEWEAYAPQYCKGSDVGFRYRAFDW